MTVRCAVSKQELRIPSPQSSPPCERGEADRLMLKRGSHSTRVASGSSPCGIGFIFAVAIVVFYVTSCATYSQHEFSEPATGWQAKTGQLMYRTPKTTLIGEAVVRFSKTGDFELTVSKGPGITLLSLRQDSSFAEVKGAFARQGWSGPVENAPPQLRSWLGLRDQFVHAPDRKTMRYVSGDETFVFRF